MVLYKGKNYLIFLIILVALLLETRCAPSSEHQIKTEYETLCDSAAQLYADGKYQSAYEIFKDIEMSDYRGMPVSEKVRAKTLLHISWIHYFYGDYSTSLDYAKRSDSILWQLHDTIKSLNAKSHIACLLSLMRQFDEADSVNRQMHRLLGGKRNQIYGWRVQFNRGVNAQHKGNLDESIGYYRAALGMVPEDEGSAGRIASIYSGLTDCYSELKLADSIQKYIELYEKYAFQSDQRQLIVASLRDQMLFNTRYGDRKLALDYQQRYLTFLDSLLNTASFLKTQSIFNEKKENYTSDRIHTLSITVSRQYVTILGVGIVAFLLFILALFLFSRNRIVKKANKALYDKYQLLIEKESKESRGVDADLKVLEEEDPENSRLFKAIKVVMEESEIWCDPEFDLKRLSEAVGSTPRSVSEILNSRLHKNFRSFVGEYRVREACKRMREKTYEHYSIDGIGESVGFGSRHTFLRTFKKETGLLPSVYRKLSEENKKCSDL